MPRRFALRKDPTLTPVFRVHLLIFMRSRASMIKPSCLQWTAILAHFNYNLNTRACYSFTHEISTALDTAVTCDHAPSFYPSPRRQKKKNKQTTTKNKHA